MIGNGRARVSRVSQVQATEHAPHFTSCTWPFGARQPWSTGVNECRPLSLVVNSLQINDKFSRIALGIRYDFRSEEGYNMVGYDLTRFRLEIGVVDA